MKNKIKTTTAVSPVTLLQSKQKFEISWIAQCICLYDAKELKEDGDFQSLFSKHSSNNAHSIVDAIFTQLFNLHKRSLSHSFDFVDDALDQKQLVQARKRARKFIEAELKNKIDVDALSKERFFSKMSFSSQHPDLILSNYHGLPMEFEALLITTLGVASDKKQDKENAQKYINSHYVKLCRNYSFFIQRDILSSGSEFFKYFKPSNELIEAAFSLKSQSFKRVDFTDSVGNTLSVETLLSQMKIISEHYSLDKVSALSYLLGEYFRQNFLTAPSFSKKHEIFICDGFEELVPNVQNVSECVVKCVNDWHRARDFIESTSLAKADRDSILNGLRENIFNLMTDCITSLRQLESVGVSNSCSPKKAALECIEEILKMSAAIKTQSELANFIQDFLPKNSAILEVQLVNELFFNYKKGAMREFWNGNDKKNHGASEIFTSFVEKTSLEDSLVCRKKDIVGIHKI